MKYFTTTKQETKFPEWKYWTLFSDVGEPRVVILHAWVQ